MAVFTFTELPQWILEKKEALDAVIKQSTQDVISVAQVPKAKGGPMPVRDGTLRKSLKSTVAGGAGSVGPDSHIMVAGSMKAGSVARFTWTVNYARYVNDGVRGRPGAHFVEAAADQWQQIVAANVARISK